MHAQPLLAQEGATVHTQKEILPCPNAAPHGTGKAGHRDVAFIPKDEEYRCQGLHYCH